MISRSPTILVIFGATGDLMKKKIGPALWTLFQAKKLPSLFSVVGFARRNLDDDAFRRRIKTSLTKPGPAKSLREFLNHFFYQPGFFDHQADYRRLGEKLGLTDHRWQTCANKLFYLAVPPRYDQTILANLASSGLTKPCGPDEGWTRVLIEKPFGKNLNKAQELDRLLGKLFKEEQVFRIDHYLAKEALQNIIAFRFANNLLEGVWDHKHLESVEVKILETRGLEGRGSFYDQIGALRDVGQNHLLQMLALATMANPGEFKPEQIRQKRAMILKSLKVLSKAEIINQTRRGQFRGYREEKDTAPDSQTETYFKIKTTLETPRWKGVKITLEGGKRMAREDISIMITFRHPRPCLCPPNPKEHLRNRLSFRLLPEPGIAIQFWAKKPGAKMVLESRQFKFKSGDGSTKPLEAYTKLILDVLSGDQTLFVSSEEALASWRFIDPIINAWRQNLVKLELYGTAPC